MAISFTAGKPAENQSFLLKNGEYNFRIVDAVETTSQAGDPMIELKTRVIKDDGSLGVYVFERMVVTPKTYWKVDALLTAIGQHPGEGQVAEIDVQQFIGEDFRAWVKTEDSQNGKRNVFGRFLPRQGDVPF